MNTKETAPMVAGDAKPFSVDEPINWYLHHAAAAADKTAAKEVRTSARDEYMRQFGVRCKLARGTTAIDDVANLIGVHRNTIWNIERGQTLPDAFELEVIAKAYKTTPIQLLEGGQEQEMAPCAAQVEKSVRAIESDGFVYVPLFDIRVSAGNGAFSDVEAVVAMRPFDSNFIRYELGISHNDIDRKSVV